MDSTGSASPGRLAGRQDSTNEPAAPFHRSDQSSQSQDEHTSSTQSLMNDLASALDSKLNAAFVESDIEGVSSADHGSSHGDATATTTAPAASRRMSRSYDVFADSDLDIVSLAMPNTFEQIPLSTVMQRIDAGKINHKPQYSAHIVSCCLSQGMNACWS
jgi:hypothetical protein